MRLKSLQGVSIAIAEERSLDVILHRLVQGLVNEDLALVRVWLLDAGDICEKCPLRRECAAQTRCLHLVASAGRSLDGTEDWSRLTGDFRRIPLNARKVGHIGATGSSVLIPEIGQEERWKPRADWVARESIRSFAGHPLIFRGEILGVLGVFSRTALNDEAFEWLQMFANHAAVSIANARAFSEIERLKAQLERRVSVLTAEVDALGGHRRIIGESSSWRSALKQASQVAATDTTVLLLGESGTGKEVLARFIHRASARNNGPFVAINCAALPEQLLESELFGHERGAFTGAMAPKPGQLELAASGVLFLDEVSEMSPSAQAKFLRVLQEREFQRLGGTRVLRANVRVIAATNRDLAAAIARGTFREDLYYRLNVFEISLPRLRDRPEDIVPLCEAFLKDIGRAFGRPPAGISREARRLLTEYHWPGNVRQLRNALERAAILCEGGLITADHLALNATTRPSAQPLPSNEPTSSAAAAPIQQPSSDLQSVERAMIEQALQNTRFNKSKAAKALGLTRHQLYVRMKKHGFE
jgi:transcriptional regulator with GAF, ATPase, and Fis domain